MLMGKERLVWFAIAAALIGSQLPAQEPAPPPTGSSAIQQPPPGQQAPEPQPAAQQPQAPPQPAPATGLQWEVGNYKVKLGGRIKVDLIHDFDEIGSTDSFDPRTIPTDDETNPGENTRLHARETRLNLDVRGPTSVGDMRLFVEGDFFGDGSSFRLRHAYGTIRGVLGGQTWTTFMDDDAMPETLDFESPIGFPQIRQAMVRYTGDLGDGNYAAIAIEEPASKILTMPVPGETEEATPDFTGRLRWAHGLGHCQLGLFGGTARYDPETGTDETALLWGLNLSAKLDLLEKDNFIAQVTYGPGVGRYRGGITAGPDANGALDAVEILAVMVGYQHHWSDEFRSNVTYSWASNDLPAGSAPDTPDKLEYLAANLIWQFCDKAWVGVEYLYGSREDLDDTRGEAHRLQASIRFNF